MTFETECMETELLDMQPVRLSDELLARLERAMMEAYNGASAEQELSLEELELALGQLAPSGLGEGFLSRMDSAMQDWQEEGEKEAKIVPFSPEEKNLDELSESSQQERSQGRAFWNYASVAAVALFGGVAALMMTGTDGGDGFSQPTVAQLPSAPSANTSGASVSPAALQQGTSSLRLANSSAPHPIQLTNSTANRNIIGVSSQGIRNNQNDQPCRCLRVEYIDVIELRNSEGKRIRIEEPKVEYLYIPLERN